MRWFWLLIGLIGVGAAVVVFAPSSGAGGGDTAVAIERGERTRSWTPPGVDEQEGAEEAVADKPAVDEVQAGGPMGPMQPVRDVAAERTNEDGGGEAEDVVVMDDGSLMLSGRYRMTGRGTAEEPYTVTWDLLKSAEEGYAPVMGKTDIPDWIEMLGGMYVQIDGFMMNPTLEEEVGEFLLMKNSWDACCLGLPPTPYDSMEVALGEKARMPELLHARASVVGRLGVSPSLVAGRFLTGLYTLDDARAVFRAGL